MKHRLSRVVKLILYCLRCKLHVTSNPLYCGLLWKAWIGPLFCNREFKMIQTFVNADKQRTTPLPQTNEEQWWCLVCLSVIIQEHFDQFNLTRPVHKDMITCAILFGFTKDENKWNWNKEEKEGFFNSKSIKKTERPRLLVLHCSNWLHYNGKNPVKNGNIE